MGGAYDPWQVPIVVDGSAAAIEGTLVYEESVSPLPYVGLAIIVAGLLGFYGRGADRRVTAALLAAVSAGAVVVGWADYASTPDGGGNPLHWALAAVALATAVGALLLARRAAGVVLLLASVAALSGWALFRIEVLLKPVLPTDLPYALDRTVVALALGVSVGAAVVALASAAVPPRPRRRRGSGRRTPPGLRGEREGGPLRVPLHQEVIRLRRSPTRT